MRKGILTMQACINFSTSQKLTDAQTEMELAASENGI